MEVRDCECSKSHEKSPGREHPPADASTDRRSNLRGGSAPDAHMFSAFATAIIGIEPHHLCDERFFFHQLLAGRDVANPDKALGAVERALFATAKSMQNYMYLVGDASSGECVAVDAAYDPAGVVAAGRDLGCNVTAALGTHFHYDHIGHENRIPLGPGMVLPGLRYFVNDLSLPGYIHETERATAAMQIGLAPGSLKPLSDGDVLSVGDVRLRIIHTPGHSPGGMTIVASLGGTDRLALTGDTVFPGSCGRLDLPGSSVEAMYGSLQALSEALGDDSLPLFPGHAYNGASSTVGRERATGLLRPMTREQWKRMMS